MQLQEDDEYVSSINIDLLPDPLNSATGEAEGLTVELNHSIPLMLTARYPLPSGILHAWNVASMAPFIVSPNRSPQTTGNPERREIFPHIC